MGRLTVLQYDQTAPGFVFKPFFICSLRCKTDLPVFGRIMSTADSRGLCHRSRRDGERSSKRKRHHAEHAEPAASQHVPAGPVPASDARVKLEAADEVVSPSKRVKKEPAAIVKASIAYILIAMWHYVASSCMWRVWRSLPPNPKCRD